MLFKGERNRESINQRILKTSNGKASLLSKGKVSNNKKIETY